MRALLLSSYDDDDEGGDNGTSSEDEQRPADCHRTEDMSKLRDNRVRAKLNKKCDRKERREEKKKKRERSDRMVVKLI